MIQSLLKMARLDAGSIRFDRQPHPVHELVERALAPFTARAAQEGKRLLTEGAPDQILCCDLEWTGEALGNLVKNALDHTERGGTVRVQWQSAPALFRLSVCDDGSGIPPKPGFRRPQRGRAGPAAGEVHCRGAGRPADRGRHRAGRHDLYPEFPDEPYKTARYDSPGSKLTLL